MGLSVTSPASNTKLVKRQSVKDLLGIDSGVTTYDSLLDDLIQRVSDAIVDHCGRPFAQETYTETLPGSGDLILQLARTPIISVTSVTYRGDGITDYVVEDADAGWLYRDAGWRWGAAAGFTYLEKHPIPGHGLNDYTVIWVAGYNLPDDATQTKPLPGGVVQAAAEASKVWFKSRARDIEVKSKTIGDLSISYFTQDPNEPIALPPRSLGLLRRWERVA